MPAFKSLAALSLAFASLGALASEVTFFKDPPSVRTRAEVIAEVLRARATGELQALRGNGEASAFPEAAYAQRANGGAQQVGQRSATNGVSR